MSVFIRKQKLALIKVLSPEALRVLQHVDAENIITRQCYTDLIQKQNQEVTIICLLDKLIDNEKKSIEFLNLLEVKEFQEHFPGLEEIIKNQEEVWTVSAAGHVTRRNEDKSPVKSSLSKTAEDECDSGGRGILPTESSRQKCMAQLGGCTQPDASGSGSQHSSGNPKESEVEVSVRRADGSSDSVGPGLSKEKQDLSLENYTFARLEEWISDPEKEKELMDKLQRKLKDGEMEKIENKLQSAKGIKKHSCFNENDIFNILKNKQFKDFLAPGKHKTFPLNVVDSFFESKPTKNSYSNEQNDTDNLEGVKEIGESVASEENITENRIKVQLDESVNHLEDPQSQASEKDVHSSSEIGLDSSEGKERKSGDVSSFLKQDAFSPEYQQSTLETPSKVAKQTDSQKSVHEALPCSVEPQVSPADTQMRPNAQVTPDMQVYPNSSANSQSTADSTKATQSSPNCNISRMQESSESDEHTGRDDDNQDPVAGSECNDSIDKQSEVPLVEYGSEGEDVNIPAKSASYGDIYCDSDSQLTDISVDNDGNSSDRSQKHDKTTCTSMQKQANGKYFTENTDKPVCSADWHDHSSPTDNGLGVQETECNVAEQLFNTSGHQSQRYQNKILENLSDKEIVTTEDNGGKSEKDSLSDSGYGHSIGNIGNSSEIGLDNFEGKEGESQDVSSPLKRDTFSPEYQQSAFKTASKAAKQIDNQKSVHDASPCSVEPQVSEADTQMRSNSQATSDIQVYPDSSANSDATDAAQCRPPCDISRIQEKSSESDERTGQDNDNQDPVAGNGYNNSISVDNDRKSSDRPQIHDKTTCMSMQKQAKTKYFTENTDKPICSTDWHDHSSPTDNGPGVQETECNVAEQLFNTSGHQSQRYQNKILENLSDKEIVTTEDNGGKSEKDPLSDSGYGHSIGNIGNSSEIGLDNFEGKEGESQDVSSPLKQDAFFPEHHQSVLETPSKVAKQTEGQKSVHEALPYSVEPQVSLADTQMRPNSQVTPDIQVYPNSSANSESHLKLSSQSTADSTDATQSSPNRDISRMQDSSERDEHSGRDDDNQDHQASSGCDNSLDKQSKDPLVEKGSKGTSLNSKDVPATSIPCSPVSQPTTSGTSSKTENRTDTPNSVYQTLEMRPSEVMVNPGHGNTGAIQCKTDMEGHLELQNKLNSYSLPKNSERDTETPKWISDTTNLTRHLTPHMDMPSLTTALQSQSVIEFEDSVQSMHKLNMNSQGSSSKFTDVIPTAPTNNPQESLSQSVAVKNTRTGPSVKKSQGQTAKRKRDSSAGDWKKERLLEWAEGYANETGCTVTELKKRMSIINRIEHKQFPCLVADQCIIFQDPNTDQNKIIFPINKDIYQRSGELISEYRVKLQYQMGVSGVDETIVLSPNSKTKPIRNNRCFDDTIESVQVFVFEVLAPAIVVYKKIQRDRELF